MDINTDSEQAPDEVERALSILRKGNARIEGVFPLGSNTTLLCQLESDGGTMRAVYKPAQGERPLWDFPEGSLGRREAAAFEVSRALGWNFVPPTVFRLDGPFGPGSFQEFLSLNPREHYFTLRETAPDAVRRVAAFDVLINNADRKAMHVVRDMAGRIWLIDHGVCFHAEFKLRTVIWDFAGEDISEPLRDALQSFSLSLQTRTSLSEVLKDLLSPEEVNALGERADALVEMGCLPEPGPGWNVPWPIWA
jgi:hypothetical protein